MPHLICGSGLIIYKRINNQLFFLLGIEERYGRLHLIDPGGSIDHNETLSKTAIREFNEETYNFFKVTKSTPVDFILKSNMYSLCYVNADNLPGLTEQKINEYNTNFITKQKHNNSYGYIRELHFISIKQIKYAINPSSRSKPLGKSCIDGSTRYIIVNGRKLILNHRLIGIFTKLLK